jgi:hypothetical protein
MKQGGDKKNFVIVKNCQNCQNNPTIYDSIIKSFEGANSENNKM